MSRGLDLTVKGTLMPSISPLIVRIFDDPHANARNGKRAKRNRAESKGRLARRRSSDI